MMHEARQTVAAPGLGHRGGERAVDALLGSSAPTPRATGALPRHPDETPRRPPDGIAVLGSRLGHLSPFLSVGVALTLGGLVGLARVGEWRVPMPTLALGVGDIFGYHALLFAAFRLAPAVEVNLLQYLWPVLIVAGAVVAPA